MIKNRISLTLYTNTPLNINQTVVIKLYCNNNEFKYKYNFIFSSATKKLLIDIIENKIIALLNTHSPNELLREISQRILKNEKIWIE
jgi:hypothetical protein